MTDVRYPQPTLPDNDRIARIQAACPALEPLFRGHAEQNHVPGVAYGVVAGGELIFSHSFGVRELTTQAPVDADTVFRIASMTKSFTAAAILHLRDTGNVRLDEAVAVYVPELAGLRYPTADSAPITVRQLLTMSAGWPQDDPWADRQLYRADGAMSAFYRDGVAWSNPPGMLFEYSNYGYMVLGRIITNVSGIPAVDYINRELLQPLGMTSTFWDPTAVPPARLAHGYRWEDEQWKEEVLLPCGGDVACFAGIFTTVRDLARWVHFFLDAWPPRDDAETAPLRRSTRREMQQIGAVDVPELKIPSDGSPPTMSSGGYGFGIQINHDGQLCSVGHGGGLPGFGSQMRWLPTYDLGIVALGNVTYAGYRKLCIDALAQLVAAAGLQPRQPQVAPALAAARAGIIRLMTTWDEDVAADLFADNLLLDSDAEHRQREVAALVARHGPLHSEGPFTVENWLRGTWRMAGERGWVEVSITLSPTVPPRVQEWEMVSQFEEEGA
ncbi:MAG TPA: serine hydrolase domain-containing protein [Caldilineaceae bacterium]|nr:serine hydrolase domain-containing protein [Caldilineaceae bacterium]